MPDGLTITTETTALLAALQQLPALVRTHVKRAARVTADRIVREAAGRVARRTGATAAGLTVEETHSGDGYVVFVKRVDEPGLPGWLEHGTKFMTKRPFLFVSARLEEGAHERRTRDAIQDAIDEKGLGD